MNRRRLPIDFRSAVALVRDPTAAVQLIVLARPSFDWDPFAVLPVPIVVPSIQERASEVPWIVDEYGDDAVRDLSAERTGFTPADHDWVIEHSASTLSEIEKGTHRLVAIRQASSINGAAVRLGLSHPALSQWLYRRKAPPTYVTADQRGGPGKEGES